MVLRGATTRFYEELAISGCDRGWGGPADERAIAHEEHEHRDEIGKVPDQLEDRRRGSIPEQAVEDAAERAGVRQHGAEVEGDAGVGDEPGLPELVDRERNEPGRDEDQDRAGHGEEPAKVDPSSGDEDRPAGDDRAGEAQHTTRERVNARAVE